MERRNPPPMVVEMRKVGMALAGVIALWAASQAFLGWQTLAAVRDMKAALPDTVEVTKTDTIHDCGRRDARNDASPF